MHEALDDGRLPVRVLPMFITSPKTEARVAGALYVLVILLGGFAEIGGRQGVVTPNDPAATAHAILLHRGLFRAGFAAEAITNLIAIPVTLILYRLLAPVSRGWVLLAVVFDLTQNAINAMNAGAQFLPLTLLGGSPDLASIPQAELAAFARLALKVHDIGFDIALTFFGVALAIYGVVIFRSGFFPRWLGVLYGFAGLCYLANSFIYFLAPSVSIGPDLLLGSLVGEGALALWLLIVGVDEVKWAASRALPGAVAVA